MDVKQAGQPTFTLKVNLKEMRLLIVATDMLGTASSTTPSHPLSSELQDEYNSMYYDLTNEGGLVDEDTDETLKALGIEAKEDCQ